MYKANMLVNKILAACVLVALSACTSPTVDKPEPGGGDIQQVIDYGRALIQHLMQQDDVPGVSVVLVRDRQIVWSEGFG